MYEAEEIRQEGKKEGRKEVKEGETDRRKVGSTEMKQEWQERSRGRKN